MKVKVEISKNSGKVKISAENQSIIGFFAKNNEEKRVDFRWFLGENESLEIAEKMILSAEKQGLLRDDFLF